jgi:hypothetical protein
MQIPKIGSHHVNPQRPAKTGKHVDKVVAKSIMIQGKEPNHNTYSQKVPNKKEALRITQAVSHLLLTRGKSR